MFEKSTDELKAMGADITTAEIAQQPDLWEDTFQIYADHKAEIETFLAEANAMGEGRTVVVFTGAGTSDYVGDTCASYLRRAGDTDTYDFKPIATTDIVSAPYDYLRPADPHDRGVVRPLRQQPREPRCGSDRQAGCQERQVPQHHLRA